MRFENIQQAEAYLGGYVANGVSRSGDNMTLERMWPLLKAVGSPQDKLKVVHVAGTSGKTSTCYYIAHILQKSGRKTGLTVSPHIDSITERLQIGGQNISDEKFCKYLEEFLECVDESLKPSYFELLIAFFYWVFAREKVDYAVMETGMGGMFDSTNVATRTDKVCVITDIGLDHTRILGDTVDKIAAQKAGVVHEENQVFIYEQAEEILQSVQSRVKEKNAQLHLVSEPVEEDTQLPLFQQRNFHLAQTACEYIASRDNFELQKLDPEEVTVPGRMEVFNSSSSGIVILDGAHNGQKMTTFVRSFMKQYPGERPVILLALKQGKEYTEVIDALEPIANSIIITTYDTSQDLPAVSEEPSAIANYCEQKGIASSSVPDRKDALDKLLALENDVKIITGSLYLLSQVRAQVTKVV